MEHTKGELTVDGWNGRAGLCIWDSKLNHIFTAEIPYPLGKEQQVANAKHLALCWNSHNDLLAACEEFMTAWIQDKPRSLHDVKTDMDAAYAQAKAATTKARNCV